MNYRSKMKKTAAILCSGIIAVTPPLYATGIPVVDGVANGILGNQLSQTVIHWGKEITQWGKEIAHWKQQVETWRAELQSRIRGALSKFDKVESSRELSETEIKQIFDKRKTRCNQLSNEQSKALCNNAVELDKEKVKYYFEAEKIVDKQMRELDLKIERYQSMLRNSNNLEQLNSVRDDVQNQLQHIENIMTIYDRKIKLVEAKQEMVQKARVTIANEQLQGNYSSDTVTKVAKTAVYGSVVGTLKSQAKGYRDDAANLRKETAGKSNTAFYR